MRRILIYSGLLLAGMAAAQAPGVVAAHGPILALSRVCLAYIMIQVGLEFSAEAKVLSHYVADAWIAAAAAVAPWLLCTLYFAKVIGMPLKSASLLALFAAATSAGILFTMLSAAGLGSTWVFKKARVLAVADDLVTVLLLIPIQIVFIGFHWQFIVIVGSTLLLIGASARWMNRLFWRVRKPWLLLYGVLIALIASLAEHWGLHTGVLLPAFAAGCILHHQGTLQEADDPHSWLDQGLKGVFLLLVGCSLPAFSMSGLAPGHVVGHVLAITMLANLGKCVPFLFYRKEVSPRERLALSVAMFPRGEVGAGILLVALVFGITGVPLMLASLSLALNLLLTGVFVAGVKVLSQRHGSAPERLSGSSR